jgi:glycosyltransferase involved in cell wall biosynthesis
MKIIHCIYSFCTGGAENMLVDILNEQSVKNQIELIIINDDFDKDLIQTINSRVKIVFLKRKCGSRSIYPILKLNMHINKFKPDIIHIHNDNLARIIVLHSNLFLSVHDMHISNKSFNKCYKLLAISESVKNDILRKGSYPVCIIPNGIPIKKIKTISKLVLNRTFKIIQVARLEHLKKGQHILIEALAIVVNKYNFSNIEVDFIGQGDSLNYLVQLTKQSGLVEHVHFLGLKNRAYIYENLCNYNLMCHPALYEGFGLTVAEGIAAGIPVLVSNCDGPFEIIESGKYGFFFERGNVEDCAKKIVDIISIYETISDLTNRAYTHIIENYTIEKQCELFNKEYSKLLHSKNT